MSARRYRLLGPGSASGRAIPLQRPAEPEGPGLPALGLVERAVGVGHLIGELRLPDSALIEARVRRRGVLQVGPWLVIRRENMNAAEALRCQAQRESPNPDR